MALKLALVIDGNASGAKKAATETETALKGVGTSANKAGAGVAGVGAAAGKAGVGLAAANAHMQMSRQLMYQMVDIGQGIPLAFQSPTYALENFGFQVAQIGQLYYGQGGMAQAMRDIRDMAEAAATRVLAFLNPVTVSIGVLGGAAAAAYALDSAYEAYAKSVDDAARATGIATDELARLQNVAAFHGIDQSQFFGDMTKFADEVDHARNGMGGLAQLLTANGERAGNFADSMGKVADLVMRAANDQQRLRVLQEAGLPATMDYVRMLSQGADGIKAQLNETAQFGNAFDRNMIDKAREFDEQWHKAWVNFGIEARGSIQEVRDKIDELDQKAGDWLRRHLPFGLGQVTPQSARATIAAHLGSQLSIAEAGRFYDATGADKGAGVVDPAVLQHQLDLESKRIGLLGTLAGVEEKVRAEEIRIQQARLAGVGISAEQERALLNLTHASAEWGHANNMAAVGVFDLANASKAAKDQLQAWIDQGLLDPNNPAQMAKAVAVLDARIRQLKQSALDADPALRALRDAQFQREQIGRSSGEQSVASTLRGVYGESYKDYMDGAVASTLRLNQTLQDAHDTGLSFFTDMESGLRRGGKFWDVFDNAAGHALDHFIQKQIEAVYNQAFNALTGGGFSLGGIFGGLFGGGGATGGMGISLTNTGSLFDVGGYTGNAPAKAIAGVVHGQEFVFDAPSTRAIGVNNLYRMMHTARGYAAGGYVGAPPPPTFAGTSRSDSKMPAALEITVRVESDSEMFSAKVTDISADVVAKAAPAIVRKAKSDTLSAVPKTVSAMDYRVKTRGLRPG